MKFTLIRRLKCFFGVHDFVERYSLDATLSVACLHCSAVAYVFHPLRWIQVREAFGVIDTFVKTFNDPEDVPRAQRVLNSKCYPIFVGTAYEFEGAFRGSSPLDKKAIEDEKKRTSPTVIDITEFEAEAMRRDGTLTVRELDALLDARGVTDAAKRIAIKQQMFEKNKLFLSAGQ